MRGADKLLLQVDGLQQLRRIALQAMATGKHVFVTVPSDSPRVPPRYGIWKSQLSRCLTATKAFRHRCAGYHAAGKAQP